jgi:hypothetical protein
MFALLNVAVKSGIHFKKPQPHQTDAKVNPLFTCMQQSRRP